MLKTRRFLNIPLVLGSLIIISILFAILFNDALRTSDPYSLAKAKITAESDGSTSIIRPPFPPNHQYFFGTDELGRDIYSQIIYGVQLTMKIAVISVIIRLVIALPFGFWAAFGSKIGQEIINQSSLMAAAVPALIINYLILNLQVFKNLELRYSIIAFAIIIGITEWGRIGKLIQGKIEEILHQPFVKEGDRIIGKNNWQIATRSVTPHLLPFLVVYMCLEISRSLIMLMHLGVFSVFLGNREFDSDTISLLVGRKFSYEPEWSGIMADAPKIINTSWWIVVFPAAAFFISILGFNLFAEGLRDEFEKENSKLYSRIRKSLSFLSPKAIVRDIRYRNKKANLMRASLLCAILILIAVTEYHSPYPFNSAHALEQIKVFEENLPFQHAITGSNALQSKQQYIIATLGKYISEFKNGYIQVQKFTPQSMGIIDDVLLTLETPDESMTYSLRDGIVPYNYTEGTISGELTIMPSNLKFPSRWTSDFFRLSDQYAKSNDKIFIIQDNAKNYADIFPYIMNLSAIAKPRAVIVINENTPDIIVPMSLEPYTFELGNTPILFVKGSWTHTFLETDNKKVSITMSAEPLKSDIENIIAVIPGTHESLKEEIILMGVGYDGFTSPLKQNHYGSLSVDSGLAVQMEIIRTLASIEKEPKRTLGFIFWDASQIKKGSGAALFKGIDALELKNTEFFISLGPMGYKYNEKLVFDTSKISNTRPNSQTMVESVKKIQRGLKLTTVSTKPGTKESDALYRNGYPCLSIYSDGTDGIVGTQQDVIDAVDQKQLGKMGQLILDSIIKLAY